MSSAQGSRVKAGAGAEWVDGFRRPILLALIIALLLTVSCTRPPADTSPKGTADAQSLPFDREPRSGGVSPSQSLLPATTTLPEGTPIYVRLNSLVSSSSSHAGDVFNAVVDEPIELGGEALVERGAAATGRVLEAKPSSPGMGAGGAQPDPGYLRIVLVSLNSHGRTIAIETSSIFAKGGIRHEPNAASKPSPDARPGVVSEVEFGPNRRLNFRLAHTVELPSPGRPPRASVR